MAAISAGILWSVFALLIALHSRYNLDLFEPLTYFLFIGLLMFGLPIAILAVSPEILTNFHLTPSVLSIGSIYIAASFLFFSLGYYNSAARKLLWAIPLVQYRKKTGHLLARSLTLYCIGWSARLARWALGDHHRVADVGESLTLVSSILSPMSLFATLSFLVISWQVMKKWNAAGFAEKRGVFLVGALGALEVFSGMVQGSRSEMLIPFLYTAFIYNYGVRKIKIKEAMLAVLVFVVVLVPSATAYRMLYYQQLDEEGATTGGAIHALKEVISPQEPRSEVTVGSVTPRLFAQTEGALKVINDVPESVRYAKGATFFPGVIFVFVPRVFWSSKPTFNPGREFAQEFWGVGIGETHATNMGISWVGETFYNFGWFGISLGFLLGIICQWFSSRAKYYLATEDYGIVRLFFVVFVVLGISHFETYPAGITRNAVWFFVYLTALYGQLPTFVKQSSGNKRIFFDKSLFKTARSACSERMQRY